MVLVIDACDREDWRMITMAEYKHLLDREYAVFLLFITSIYVGTLSNEKLMRKTVRTEKNIT